MLEIAACASGAWQRLDADVGAHVEGFLRESPRAPVRFESDAPPAFLRDLAEGGSALRAAFPELRRRVVWIDERDDRVAVRIACTARHDGTFYGLARPTGRVVRFAELHELLVDRGALVEDRITLDLRAIVRQLVAARSSLVLLEERVDRGVERLRVVEHHEVPGR